MKKILISLIALTSIYGCQDTPTQGCQNTQKDSIIYENFREAFGHRRDNINRFYENGHTYIMFISGNSHRGYMGIVHDPDCKKCKNNIMFPEE